LAPRETAGHQSDRASKGTDLNVMLGRRIRLRRTLLGMSQARLAAQLSVSQQQVALFESGEGRLFASHIYLLGRALGVPVDFFFGLSGPRQDAAVSMTTTEPSRSPSPMTERIGTSNDGRLDQEVQQWIQAFSRIPPGDSRSRLLDLIYRLSG